MTGHDELSHVEQLLLDRALGSLPSIEQEELGTLGHAAGSVPDEYEFAAAAAHLALDQSLDLDVPASLPATLRSRLEDAATEVLDSKPN
jgi:hypothetical protein